MPRPVSVRRTCFEPVDGGGRQCGRRLVEHQDSRPAQQRPRDLRQLLVGEREFAEQGAGLDVESQLGEHGARGAVHRGPVEQPEAPRRTVGEEVLPHRQIGEEAQLLGDDGDSAATRASDGEPHRPVVRPQRARQDPHERRLARPVLTDQRVDLPAPQPDARSVQGPDPAVRLDQALRGQHVAVRHLSARPSTA